MKTKSKNIFAAMLTILLVLTLTVSCASAKMMKSAEAAWDEGNFIEALQFAIQAVQEDENADAKVFLKDRYAETIATSEQQLKDAENLAPVERGNEKIRILLKLIDLNKNMQTLSFPFTDKKQTYTWEPEEIKDFAPILNTVVNDVVAAYLDVINASNDWTEIVNVANDALSIIPNEAIQKGFKISVAKIIFGKADTFLQATEEEDLAKAIEGFKISQEWNQEDPEFGVKTNEGIQKAKAKIAEIYYQKGLALFEANKGENFSRQELKDAIVAFKTANSWVESYQSADQHIASIKKILAIYYYAIFPQEDYSLSVDNLLEVFLTNLTPLLEEESNVHFDKFDGDASYTTALSANVLSKKPSSPYAYPAFIATAENAGVFYLTNADISTGTEIAETEFTEKETEEFQEIIRKEIKIVKKEGLKKIESTIKLTKEEYEQLATQIPEKGVSIQKAAPSLIQFIADKGTTFNLEEERADLFFVDTPDKAPFKLKTITYSYPLQVKYDLIDIRDYAKRVIKSDLLSRPVEGVYKCFISEVLDDELFKWIDKRNYSFSEDPLLIVDDSVVTPEVLNAVFTEINTVIAEFLNEMD